MWQHMFIMHVTRTVWSRYQMDYIVCHLAYFFSDLPNKTQFSSS